MNTLVTCLMCIIIGIFLGYSIKDYFKEDPFKEDPFKEDPFKEESFKEGLAVGVKNIKKRNLNIHNEDLSEFVLLEMDD
jgi:hypothetical protein